MKTLLIMRHAKSGWDDPTLSDHDRPLNDRGKRDAPRMGQLIESEGLTPDLVVSSTAARARTTAVLVTEAAGYQRAIEIHKPLYLATPAEIIEVLQNLFVEADIVLVIGHNAGLEEFLSDLVSEPQVMPTAALAQVALPIDTWEDLSQSTEGVLVNLWYPKEIHD